MPRRCERGMLAAALRYAEHYGWAVLPCVGKHPVTPHGFKDATLDPERIREWWCWAPTRNIGVRLPPDLLALDIDPRNGGDADLAELERVHGALPLTPEVLTGGLGRHIYFRAPTDVRACKLTPASR